VLGNVTLIPFNTVNGKRLNGQRENRTVFKVSPKGLLDFMTYTVVPHTGGGSAIFSWHNDAPKAASLFVKPLRSLSPAKLGAFLVEYFFAATEVVAFSCDAWKRFEDLKLDANLLGMYARNPLD
jgi:hypothetical protein